MTELNEQQAAAVAASDLLSLIVAGPGSGKTRVMAAKIAQLVSSGTPPEEVVAVTFTNAAGAELASRIEETQPGLKVGYVGTLHGYCLRLLRDFGRFIKAEREWAVIDEELAEECLKLVVKDLGFKGSKKELERALLDGSRTFENLHAAEYGSLGKADLVALEFYKRLLGDGLLTFDLILLAARLIARSPEFRRHMEEEGRTLGHLFVDEFQDSSELDFEIYVGLPFDSRTFVGDPDQAIYGFRGGCVDGIVELSEEPECVRYMLPVNYRSGADICDVASKVIQNNRNRVGKSVVPADGAEDGVIQFFESPWPDDELREICRFIKEEELADVALLFRTNALCAEASKVLESCGLSVRQREVKELPEDWRLARTIIALLAAPWNDIIAYRLLSLWQGAEAAGDARKESLEQLSSINEAADLVITDARGAHDPAVFNELAEFGITDASMAAVQARIDLLPEDASLADLSLAMGVFMEEAETDGEGVTVSTVHAAKGREWHTVFLPSLEADIWPGRRKDVNVEEERRLFFVAFTRAKRRVVLSRSLNRVPPFKRKGGPTEPSPFIEEARSSWYGVQRLKVQ